MNAIRPDMQTLPDFYTGYVMYVKELEVFEALTRTSMLTQAIIDGIPETKGEYRYQPAKWSIKEVLCHSMDTERIFAYRALCFARGDETPLPGFEENNYAPQANAHARTLYQLANEMVRLRQTTLDLFTSFTPAMLQRKGIANHTEISVLNLAYCIAGHEWHHAQILQKRYLTH